MNMIAINADLMTNEEITDFIKFTNRIIYAGTGKLPAFSQNLGLNHSTPIKCLLGINANDRAIKLFAEAAYAQATSCSLETARGIWTTEPNWLPKNKHATKHPIEDSHLDIEFMESIGVSLASWDKDILLSNGVIERERNGAASRDDMHRAWIALAIFGFQDPNQFFHSA